MQVSINAYDNFINSINSDETKEQYEYCLTQFLKYCQMNLDSFLKLPRDEISNLIVNYLLQRKVSRQYTVLIFSAIKHACEMNDVVLNWTKMKKFIRTDNRDNSINGKDRGYTDKEIQKILDFSDQRSKTAFLLLASAGMRIGALQSIKLGDLERIDDLYKIIVYSGDREEYITFTTPECTKEIDSYLEYRTRRGDQITQDSYLIVMKFTQDTMQKGKPFTGKSITGLNNKSPKTRYQKERKKLLDRIEQEKDEDFKRELRKGNLLTIINNEFD